MPKDLAIFDLYGTLIVDNHVKEREQYRLDAIWSILEKAGYPIRFKDVIDAYNEVREYVFDVQKDYYSVSLFEQVRLFSQKINLTDIANIKKIYDIWAFAVLQISPTLLPNIREGLLELKDNNKKIALISNTAITPGIALKFMLQEMHVYEYFDDFVFSDEFGFMKPKRMIFDRVLEFTNVPCTRAVFIGDHEHYDKFGAKNAGIDYIYMGQDRDFHEVVSDILTIE